MIFPKITRLLTLTDQLDPQVCGEKATRLAQLKQAGFPVPVGWILLPANKIESLDQIPVNSYPSWIVRSSALGEDSDRHSGAGQYLSIGPVTTVTELTEAVNRCRQSYWEERAIAYRRHRTLPDQNIAILIQPYIPGQVAGVMFTRHPLDGGSQVIIEALPGGAEGVVKGQSTPLHLEIDFSTTTRLEQSLQLAQTQLDIIRELVKQAQAIEAFFHGLPQDIEWSWDGEKVWILQSRSITNLDPIWTRTIAAEVIPGVIHPLTWSINRPLTCGVWGEIFQMILGEKSAGLDFNQTATLLGSHAYFNATLLGEIFRMMGLPEQGLEFLLRGQKISKPPLRKVLSGLPGWWRLLQKERILDQEFHRDLQQIFLPALQSLAQIPAADLSLTGLLARAIKIQVWLKKITYYNILGPIGLAIRRSLFKIPQEWLNSPTAPEIASLRQLQQLATKLKSADLPKFPTGVEIEFQRWINTYGYLSEVGTDIAVSTWCENPDHLRQILINMAQNPVTAKPELLSSQLNWWQNWRLAQCDRRNLVKSQISEIYARFLAHLRWTFLAIEAHGLTRQELAEPGDIFYLEFREIKAWIERTEKIILTERIKPRREQVKRDRDRVVPEVVYGNLLPEVSQLPENQLGSKDHFFQGIPASAGCVEGYIKIYRNFTLDLTDGEKPVMLVPYTDAGWAPLLLGAKAIIAEVGGQLSHGAIIAREYGIPAVMNIPHVTTLLQDGQKVRVDGYRGTVEILDEDIPQNSLN